MKLLYILSAILMAGISASAQAPADTIVANVRVDSVMVTQANDKVTISLMGIDGNADQNITYDQHLEKNRVTKTTQGRNVKNFWDDCDEAIEVVKLRSSNGKWDAIIGGLGFGFNTALGKPAAMQTQMMKSWDIQWLYVIGARYHIGKTRNSINFGLGLDWRNYKSTLGTRFIQDENGRVAIDQFPEGVDPEFSRIKIFSLTVPVLYKQTLPINFPHNGKMWLAFGPVVNFNTHASIRTQWEGDDERTMQQSANISGRRKVTVDGLAIIGINSWLGVYFRYSPMKQLESGSPQFSSFTTGLTFGF